MPIWGKEWYSELRQDNPQDVGGVSLNVEDALVWALRAMFNRLGSRAAAHFSNRGCCYPQNLQVYGPDTTINYYNYGAELGK